MRESLYVGVGRRIRDRRTTQGLSQEELAQASELSRASISNIEAGRQQVYLHHLVSIASSLRCKLQDLVGEWGHLPKETGIDTLEHLTQDERSFLKAGDEKLKNKP